MEAIADTSSMIFGQSNRRSALVALRELFPGISIMVSKGIINELGIISRSKGARGTYARAALSEIRSMGIRVAESAAYPDRWILSRAAIGSVVVTNDTELARSLPKGVIVLKLSRNGRLRPFNRDREKLNMKHR
jgi:rRNA-processing protein FCF1